MNAHRKTLYLKQLRINTQISYVYEMHTENDNNNFTKENIIVMSILY